jgi:hypothetical protein
MTGPRVVCVACGRPAKGVGPFCDSCMGAESGPPVERCTLCERGYARDKWGLHTNKTGGYVGKCELPPEPQSAPQNGK